MGHAWLMKGKLDCPSLTVGESFSVGELAPGVSESGDKLDEISVVWTISRQDKSRVGNM